MFGRFSSNAMSIAVRQVEIASEIRRILTNAQSYVEKGKVRAQYFDIRSDKLDELILEFQENDAELVDDVVYVKSNLDKEVQDLYEKTRRFLVQQKDLIAAQKTFPMDDEDAGSTSGISSKLNLKLNLLIKLIEQINNEIASELKPDSYCQRMVELLYQHSSEIHKEYEMADETAKDFGKISNEYFSMMPAYTKLIGDLETMASKTARQPSVHQVTAHHSALKLPQVKIPVFDGSYDKWSQFKDLFTELIHANNNMGNAQKMMYLKTYLSGDALRLVQHMQVSEDNYVSSWDILASRYDNKRLQTAILLDRLTQQPNCKPESAAALKSLHDTTLECLCALKNLQINVEHWNIIMHHIIIKKLDSISHTLYEQGIRNPRDLQNLDDLLSFIELRFQSMESIGKSSSGTRDVKINSAKVHMVSNSDKCVMCNKDHKTSVCNTFLRLSVENRFKKCKDLKLCINCFSQDHTSSKCSGKCCEKCKKRHNVLLHREEKKKAEVSPKSVESASPSATLTTLGKSNDYVLLGTAVINIKCKNGELIKCRALLDNGSQLNIITEKLRKALGISYKNANCEIGGIGDVKSGISKRASVVISSQKNGYTAELEVVIIPKITSDMPSIQLNVADWPIPKNICLADPQFNIPARIDMLIGAELFCELISVGQIKMNDRLPILQNSVFGWILMGKVSNAASDSVFCGISVCENIGLEKCLQRFWSVEQVTSDQPAYTKAENAVEQHFIQTVERDSTGRFIVKLPFMANRKAIGNTKIMAERRFFAVERRLAMIPDIQKQYSEFMSEYIKLGHMEKVNEQDICSPNAFLPHHCVVRPDKSTTKLRVVFDASAKSNADVSLNDLLAIGPKLQDDLFDIMLRFRKYKYVMTADIEKMYRQVLIHPDDRNMQLIVWRFNKNDKLEYYRLKTVTYGTRSASFLATRCLKEMAVIIKDEYPLASSAIANDFYMDDVITGCDDIGTAIKLHYQLQTAMSEFKLNLRKWCSNYAKTIFDEPMETCELNFRLNEESQDFVKTLGVCWVPTTDTFHFKAKDFDTSKITKRIVISEASQLYDPLGLVNPVIVIAKLFMQKLWKLGLHWDEALPLELYNKWLSYRQRLLELNNLSIPRYVTKRRYLSRQLHAFADASEKAYGTVIYMRTIDINGEIHVNLLCSKSRVASQDPVTIPRLELNAALLMAELTSRVKKAMCISESDTYYWSDSKCVLSWLRAESSSFKIYVANRVAAIQKLSENNQWNYVNTSDNPADVISRGCFPMDLNGFWFNGPGFLAEDNEFWKKACFIGDNMCEAEEEIRKVALVSSQSEHFIDNIRHNNSFTLLSRIVAWVIRFVGGRGAIKYSELTVKELHESSVVIFKRLQNLYFSDEIDRLRKNIGVLKQSKLKQLAPFFDDEGLLRCGGRMENSLLTYNEKHPIILPGKHEIVRMLVDQLHIDNLHAGQRALLAVTRQKYWILGGSNLVRQIVHKCVLCSRAKPKIISQIMGDLPEERVRPSRPFSNVGIDFAGPIIIHHRIRGKIPTKAYICVFVCFSTKAIHLEVASDLTKEAFIGCLKRFIGRRGRPIKIFCDNATNFAGAKNELMRLYEMLAEKNDRDDIFKFAAHQEIEWRFIPPGSPHFGGLWEAAVKAMKYYLKRMLHNTMLTYEQLTTLASEIEAILNSRPLTSMSSDPSDLAVLTAGHFLIGAPLTAIPDDATEKFDSAQKYWSAVKSLKSEFWKRWSNEYLTELQTRVKWQETSKNLSPGTLVLLKDKNIPSLEWRMGRVIGVIEGADGKCRVAEIKTSTGVTRRAITKISPLPVGDEQIEVRERIINPPEKIEQVKPSTKKRKCRPIDESYSSEFIRKVNSKRKKSVGLFTYTCLFVLLFLPIFADKNDNNGFKASSISTVKNYFNISGFDHNPGLYFENVAAGNIVASEWKLMVFFDLEKYWLEYDGYRVILNKLGSLCEKTVQSTYCQEILNQFRHDLVSIQETNKLIFSHANYTLRRKRRGLFNFVGSWERFLYGTLDQNYADEMARTVEKIRNNEEHLMKLSQNQTSIIESTVNIMKKNQADVERQFRQLNQEIVELNHISGELQLSGRFTTLAVHTSLIMASYKQVQRAILDVVTRTRRDTISTLILTPDQLAREVVKIKKELPATLRLPATGKRIDLLKLYRLMSVRSQITNKMLVFEVELPLILDRSFRIFHVVPVPYLFNDELLIINYDHEYLMVDDHYERYHPMTELEIHECREAEQGNVLCMQKRPMISRQAHEIDCGFGLLIGQHGQIPKNCHFSTYGNLHAWIQLRAANTWVFSFVYGQTVDMTCNGELTNLFLNGSGLLSMEKGCIIHHNHITAAAYDSVKSSRVSDIIPKWDSRIYENVTRTVGIRNMSLQILNQTADIKALNDQIAAIRGQQRLPNDISIGAAHQGAAVYHFGVLYSLFMIGLVVGIFLIIRRHCISKGNQSGGAVVTNNFELQLRKFKTEENNDA